MKICAATCPVLERRVDGWSWHPRSVHLPDPCPWVPCLLRPRIHAFRRFTARRHLLQHPHHDVKRSGERIDEAGICCTCWCFVLPQCCHNMCHSDKNPNQSCFGFLGARLEMTPCVGYYSMSAPIVESLSERETSAFLPLMYRSVVRRLPVLMQKEARRYRNYLSG